MPTATEGSPASQLQVVAYGDSAAVVLTPAFVKALGVKIGGVVDANLTDSQVVFQSVDAAKRHREFKRVADEVFRDRDGAFRRLA